ncbi:MAG: hypothetical protein IPH75_14185 [bacterium]|nr:hypothetical protein [bacterium]
MSETPRSAQTVYDGGHIELNAEKIEKRLHEVWQMASSQYSGEMPLTKLCLSNMLVVTDATSRPEAERMANEIAGAYPSRVFLIVIDELQGAYSAFVRTACQRDKETGTLRCFEIVEMLADIGKMHYLPGALRSLLVGSVPVMAVDFRQFQTTPVFDTAILELSDYYYVNAEVVPSGPLRHRYLPLRWYWTLTIRELLGEMFGRLNAKNCHAFPVRCVIQSSDKTDTYGDLLCGWLLARLKTEKPTQLQNRILAGYREYSLVIEMREDPATDCSVRIEFNDGTAGTITRIDNPAGTYPVYRAEHAGWKLERGANAMPLSTYVVEAMQDASEFAEYASVVAAFERIVQNDRP